MIHIACNIDDNYIMQCCTTLVSVMYNNRDEQITFHIISSNLSEKVKETISKEIAEYHQYVSFYIYKANATLPSFESAHISSAAYLRLFVADILPQNINKVLYLDCDLIVDGKIKELWNIDISSCAAAAVEDMWSGKKNNYQRLAYPEKFSYFNSGVLLINLEFWRQHNISQQSIDYASKHSQNLIFNDQDILNALIYDKKKLVSFKWNVQDGFLRKKKKLRTESLPKLLEDLKHPVIIHFTGHRKPWLYLCLNPYQELFFKYVDMTKWKGTRPNIPVSWKVKSLIDRILYILHLKVQKYDSKK